MLISANELAALLKRVFEGLGYRKANTRMPPPWPAGCRCMAKTAWTRWRGRPTLRCPPPN